MNNKVEALTVSNGQSVCFSKGGCQVKPQRYEHQQGPGGDRCVYNVASGSLPNREGGWQSMRWSHEIKG